ncbi:hypothetical protein P7K49_018727 [Saguinus oedipus]|uniref:Uncharacterized protein n=1 Tax=Saguinus oedipus TaxID=9490 RepID=A0ABQ9V6W6_SAGOE|nr:hypothetical protein P7K49_018727 [Saguinus oedipus]
MPSPYQVTQPGLARPALSLMTVLFMSQLKLQPFLQGLWQRNPAEDLRGGSAATVTSRSSLAQLPREVHTVEERCNLHKEKEKQDRRSHHRT